MITTLAVVGDAVRRTSRLVCVAATLTVCSCTTMGTRGSAPWTVRCLELQGPHRLQHIEQIAETLRNTPGIRADEVFVTEESDGFVRLYYGRYRRRTDRRIGKRSLPPQMQADLDLLRQLGDDAGRRYFASALPARVPLPDVGNPAWVLADVPATYSLHVAVFEPTDSFWDFKRAAAEYCQELRGRGYEAYYHHTEACSMVTVGSFGRNAVRRGADGRTYYSQDVLSLQQKGLFKYNIVNGGIIRVRDNDGVMLRVPSSLVKIPRSAESDLR